MREYEVQTEDETLRDALENIHERIDDLEREDVIQLHGLLVNELHKREEPIAVELAYAEREALASLVYLAGAVEVADGVRLEAAREILTNKRLQEMRVLEEQRAPRTTAAACVRAFLYQNCESALDVLGEDGILRLVDLVRGAR